MGMYIAPSVEILQFHCHSSDVLRRLVNWEVKLASEPEALLQVLKNPS